MSGVSLQLELFCSTCELHSGTKSVKSCLNQSASFEKSFSKASVTLSLHTCAHMGTRFALLNYATFYLFCLEPWFLCASHLIVSPAGAALRRRAVTTYYCPCSSKPSLTSKRAHRLEEHATLNSSHYRELGLQSVPSENAGGRQEAEAVRRDGVKCPCSRRQPTPEYLLYLRHTHSVLAAAVCRTHKHHVFSVCVCGCMQL